MGKVPGERLIAPNLKNCTSISLFRLGITDISAGKDHLTTYGRYIHRWLTLSPCFRPHLFFSAARLRYIGLLEADMTWSPTLLHTSAASLLCLC